jgi:hypothetical protein
VPEPSRRLFSSSQPLAISHQEKPDDEAGI